MFGSSTGFSFGSNPTQTTTQTPIGTTLKFTAVSGTDQVQKNGVQQTINTLHQCLTAMKEYESKSLEELRYEDYTSNRKYASTTNTSVSGGGGLFGSSLTNNTSGLFGSSSNNTTTAASSSSLFSNNNNNKPTSSLFGSTPTNTNTTSLFGGSLTTGASKPLFGGATTSSTTNSGGFSFGSNASPSSTGLFGSQTATNKPSLFGSTPSVSTNTQSGGLFGSTQPVAAATTVGGGSGGLFGSNSFGLSSTTTPTATSGLFGSSTTATQAKPAFGAFGSTNQSTTSGFSFGSGTTTAPNNTSSSFGGFGNTTQSKPISGFGSPFGGSSNTTTTPALASPFGTTTANSTNSGSSLFGSSLTTQTKPLFGSTTATTTTPSGFGAFGSTSSQTASASPFGTFGTTPTTSSGLFGSSQPTQVATTTPASSSFSFGGFGGQQSTSTFTQQPTTATTSGFSGFGNSSTTLNTGTSGFAGFGGTNNLSTSSGLGTGGGGSLFGSSQPTLSTLTTSGQTNSQSFNFGNNTNNNSQLQQTTAATNTNSGQSLQLQMQALINSPYGSSPLFKNIIDDFNKKEDILKPVNPMAQKTFMQDTTNISSSSSSLLTQHKGGLSQSFKLTPKQSLLNRTSLQNNSNNNNKSLFDGLEDDDYNDHHNGELVAFMPRKNIKKLLFTRQHKQQHQQQQQQQDEQQQNAFDLINRRQSNTSNSILSGSGQIVLNKQSKRDTNVNTQQLEQEQQNVINDKVKSFLKTNTQINNYNKLNDYYLDDTVKYYLNNENNTSAVAVASSEVENISDDDDDDDDDHENENNIKNKRQEKDKEEVHVTRIILRRPDYFTIPSMDELAKMVTNDGKCLVDNFSIGRIDYGCITYPGITNVYGLNLDEIVHITRKQVNIYPDESKKPCVGLELNKQAEVTLHGVWPIDRKTREPIVDAHRICELGFNKKLERATLEMNAQFIDYDMQTGSWTFIVKHFSKYGLDDTDDENNSDDNADENHNDHINKMIKSEQKKVFDNNLMLSKQLKLIELRRLDLEKRRKLINLNNLDVDYVTSSSLSSSSHASSHVSNSNKENQLYPKLAHTQNNNNNNNEINRLQAIHTRLYPNLDLFDDMDSTSDIACNKQEIDYEQIQLRESNDECAFTNRFYSANYTNEKRNKNLTNAFFDDDDDDGNDTFNKRQELGLNGLAKKETRNVLSINDTLSESTITLLDNLKQSRSDAAATLSYQPNNKYPKLDPFNDNDDANDFNNETRLLAKHYNNRTRNELKRLDMKYVKISNEYIELNKSLLNKRFNLIADSALFNSKRFKVSFKQPLVFTSLMNRQQMNNVNTNNNKNNNNINNTLVVAFKHLNTTLNCINNIDLLNTHRDTIRANCEQYLSIQYKYSHIHTNTLEMNRAPLIVPIQGSQIINEYSLATQEIRNKIGSNPDAVNIEHMQQVWLLCESLWSRLGSSDTHTSDEYTRVSEYELNLLRKRELSKWLQQVNEHRIDREVKLCKYNKNDYLNGIYRLLTGNRLFDACKLALDNNDLHMSLLLTQLNSNREFNDLLSKQLNDWLHTNTQKHINLDRLRLYIIMSGKLTLNMSETNSVIVNNNQINVLDNLDWKRQFALHLWFNTLTIETIEDALIKYEQSVSLNLCNRPLPPYMEDSIDIKNDSLKNTCSNNNDDNTQILDTCYHLLKLYCNKTHSLNDLISPLNHTLNQLDFRLSWHLMQMLISLEYKHINDYNLFNIHNSYALQLQELDLWHWSIFVLSHINNTHTREKQVRECLCRNVCSSLELNEQEQFVVNKCKISLEWLYEAKALRAKYEHNYLNQLELLIKAKKYNQSHSLLVHTLAPNLFIKSDYTCLLKYLVSLSREHKQIQEWSSGGEIYMNFIKLNEQYLQLFTSISSDKEDKQDLCTFIANDYSSIHDNICRLSNTLKDFDVSTCLKRQCYIKISKLLLNLFYIFIELNTFYLNYDKRDKLISKSLIDRANELTNACNEHELVDKMRQIKAKYMYNALKQQKQATLTL